MSRGSKQDYFTLLSYTVKYTKQFIESYWYFSFSAGTSARSWSGWMKAWGRRTWLYMWGEITFSRTPTGSCIARAQRTWRIDCKAPFPSIQLCVLLIQNHSASYSSSFPLQVHSVWRGGGPGRWWPAEGMVHDHLPRDVQPHVRPVPHFARWPRHLYHQPLIPLQPQPPQLLQVCGPRGGQGSLW